jgi:hypothetical protein
METLVRGSFMGAPIEARPAASASIVALAKNIAPRHYASIDDCDALASSARR